MVRSCDDYGIQIFLAEQLPVIRELYCAKSSFSCSSHLLLKNI